MAGHSNTQTAQEKQGIMGGWCQLKRVCSIKVTLSVHKAHWDGGVGVMSSPLSYFQVEFVPEVSVSVVL